MVRLELCFGVCMELTIVEGSTCNKLILLSRVGSSGVSSGRAHATSEARGAPS